MNPLEVKFKLPLNYAWLYCSLATELPLDTYSMFFLHHKDPQLFLLTPNKHLRVMSHLQCIC